MLTFSYIFLFYPFGKGVVYMNIGYKVKNGELTEITGYVYEKVNKIKEGEQLSFFKPIDVSGDKNSIVIPDNVAKVSVTALWLEGLQNIYVDKGNEYFRDIDGLLCTKDGKTLVAAPFGRDIVNVPEGITAIAESAFSHNQAVKKVILPDGLETIGMCAFAYCKSLKDINIPDTVTDIGATAFSFTGIEDATLPPHLIEVKRSVFEQSELKRVVIPEGVKIIGYSAFASCQIATVNIPKSVSVIDKLAFSCNHALNHFSIPTKIKIASDSFFYTPVENLIDEIRGYIDSGKEWHQNSFVL